MITQLKNNNALFFAIFLILIACNKKETDITPKLYDVRVTSAGVNTAVVINKVDMTTGSTPTVAGTCWSATERNLTLENSSGHTINRPGADGQYTDTLKGLIYNKKHYIRAYATNNAGTAYSRLDSFITLQSPYSAGMITMGGYIVLVDSSGMHGLIAAEPQHIVYRPWANNYGLIGGTSSTIGSGYPNTQAIVTGSNNDPGTAAAYCNNLVLNGYDDWFLPSLEEIRYFADHMTFHQWLTYIMDLYWSSSESSPNQAYFAVIGGGASFNTYDKKIDHAVLPMRRF